MSAPATIGWIAQHELRLAWRDWFAMMAAGRRRRTYVAAFALIGFVAFMHGIALLSLRNVIDPGTDPDKAALVIITGCAMLAWALMISQAMESVTRAFYTRSDLDLILSSPIAARKLFLVRILTMAIGTILMALLLAGPFINVMVFWHGARWLSAYGVVISMGATATAFAVALTIALFRAIGPRRTRVIAQIVAAVIGAAFVIGLQTAAILSDGTLSRLAFLQSDVLISVCPDASSSVWLLARAMLGDPTALAALDISSFLLLATAIAIFSPRFGEHAVAAASVSQAKHRQSRSSGFCELLAPGCAPSKGMDAAAPRSVARLANADADFVSTAAGADALARVRRRNRNCGRFGSSSRDGSRPARGRSCMACNFRRGRAGTRRHCTDSSTLDRTGENRRRAWGSSDHICAIRTGAHDHLAVSGTGNRHRRGRCGHCRNDDPALVPQSGKARLLPPPSYFIACRDVRGGFLFDLMGGDRCASGRRKFHCFVASNSWHFRFNRSADD